MTLIDFETVRPARCDKAGEMTDTIRTSLEWVLQQLIEAEATAFIGASRHERSDTRIAQRNRHRPRLLSTAAGDVELGIPKPRQGSFFPSLLERRRRIDRALYAVVIEAWVHGVSTRKVDDLVKALGVASGISKSEVSRICAHLDTDLEAFRNRPLDQVEFPYVFADATYAKLTTRNLPTSPSPTSRPSPSPPKPNCSHVDEHDDAELHHSPGAIDHDGALISHHSS